MKLHFDPDLEYQRTAIQSVCDVFRGQEVCQTEFTVTRSPDETQMDFGFIENDLGIGNRLALLEEEVLKNLNDVQIRNGLALSPSLTSMDFTVEMETGTGKTYVYLRTIFELNKRFGFAKFVIVVPSIAIKEGVYKSLQIMEDHFRSLYAGVPFEYFLYDSSKLGQVRNFATSAHIQIMVVTVGAINKRDVNNLYKDSEKTGGEKPIDLIKATRPIVIVDEPQSVDGGLTGAGKQALDAMSPLCTLRYSATHAQTHHMVFRLDAVDAYEQRLVKQIEVAAATVEDAFNKPYVRYLKPEMRGKHVYGAAIEVDVQTSNGIRRTNKIVQPLDSLGEITGRALYQDIQIGQEISAKKGKEILELRIPGDVIYLRPGEAYGDVDPLTLQREMIRRTIKEHLDKEKRLRPRGIKVLSLFFIDEVSRYRQYDAEGNPVKGVYAQIFEEEYTRLAQHPDYRTLFAEVDLNHTASEVHEGYFSIDKRTKHVVDTVESNQAGRDAAEQAYSLIMKDKEKLLSFETPLKFIFSHSALREGWDNPNVFQICSLRDFRTERGRRQSIGRGLRLCVNQDGVRVRGFEVNTLTVVANESYQDFADRLQKEFEVETGIRFGYIEPQSFAGILVPSSEGSLQPLGIKASQEICDHLFSYGFVDKHGNVQDRLREALRVGETILPEGYSAFEPQIIAEIKRRAGRIKIQDADQRTPVRLRKEVYLSPEFKALWDRIKYRSRYRVEFDVERLVQECIQALYDAPSVPKTRLQWRKAHLSLGKAGVEATERDGAQLVALEEPQTNLPDLLTQLQDRTQLTRKTLHRIVSKSERLSDFKRNPQAFIEVASEAINRRKRLAIVDGIKYQRIGDTEYFAQELFETEELTGYFRNMLTETQKSVYEQVVYDSDIEQAFAKNLELDESVKVYAKLPHWFKIETPLGAYNPDWAVLVDHEGREQLYFVVETKSALFKDGLREQEGKKIECGKAHFHALAVKEPSLRYVVATKVDDFLLVQ